MNHIWAQISYSSPYEAHPKNKGLLVSKRKNNAVKTQKVIFPNPETETAH